MSRPSRTRRWRSRSAAAPMWSPTSIRAKASRSSAIRIIGAARFPSIAACGISTSCASTIIATPTPISKPSRPGSTTCAARPIRAAGRPATTFRPRATAASSRRRSPTACPNRRPAFVFNTRRPIFSDLRVRQAIALLVRCRMGQPQFLLRSLSSAARVSSTTPNCPPITAPADARERALLAPFPDAVRADVLDGTWSPPATDGSGRDRAGLRRGAHAPRRRRLRASTATVLRERASGRPLQLRDHGDEPRRGAPGARVRRQSRARRHRRASAPRRCRAIRSAPGVVRFRHDRDIAGSSRCRPATSRAFIGARPPRTRTARAIIWACAAPRSTP